MATHSLGCMHTMSLHCTACSPGIHHSAHRHARPLRVHPSLIHPTDTMLRIPLNAQRPSLGGKLSSNLGLRAVPPLSSGRALRVSPLLCATPAPTREGSQQQARRGGPMRSGTDNASPDELASHVAALVEQLGPRSLPEAQEEAARDMRSLIYAHREKREKQTAMVDAGAIEALVQLLGPLSSASVKIAADSALRALMDGHPKNRAAITKAKNH
jgi:hypothetical protein